MEANQTDREWVKTCFVTTGVNGERLRIDESVRRMVDNDHIRADLREMCERGVHLQRRYTSRPANVHKLTRWATDCVRNFNFSPQWLALGDEPGAAVSRLELMTILHRIALEEALAAVERERIRVANSPRRIRTIGYRNHTVG